MPDASTPNDSPPSLELARQVDEVVVTDEQRAAALELLEQEPHLGHVLALRRSGVAGTKGQIGAYVDDHPEFVDDADAARGKRIRAELLRRAIDGIDETIYDKDGKLVGTKTVYSDRLLEFSARMYLPEAKALRNGVVEVTGADGGPVQIEKREVSLTGVLHVLAEAGALPDELAGPLRALAAARDVLPAQPD